MINNDINIGNYKSSTEYVNAFERYDIDYDGVMSIDDLEEIIKKTEKVLTKEKCKILKEK